ncbi:uncharacterized protein LOC118437531 isoform X1 [Folsomia candida]|uniref:uncharacterized protein LOC118437531 isoform X1 n=1 Tax=Folsomia candida TaxID=158441 RepID=UPI001604FB6C|nr:uncharacterized protein LOC118437531 isoform X1 [Folsomia candida]
MSFLPLRDISPSRFKSSKNYSKFCGDRIRDISSARFKISVTKFGRHRNEDISPKIPIHAKFRGHQIVDNSQTGFKISKNSIFHRNRDISPFGSKFPKNGTFDRHRIHDISPRRLKIRVAKVRRHRIGDNSPRQFKIPKNTKFDRHRIPDISSPRCKIPKNTKFRRHSISDISPPRFKTVTKFHRHRSRLKSINTLLIYFLLIFHVRVASAGSGLKWCYDAASCGPAHWGGLCSSGKKQSPINIPTAKVTARTAVSTRIILNRNYALPKLFFVKNTGHTLQLSINADDKSKCFLLGDGLGKKPYYFSQLHFHWGPNDQVGSEHRISGKTYPLEMHMVHKQIKDPSKIAVISVLFYISPNDNPNLEPILNLAGKVKQPLAVAKTTTSNKITLTKLYPKKMRMFRYAGSLTTPPCSESVVWTVFRDPVPVSAKQMEKFRKLLSFSKKPLTTNFRPVQPTFTSVRKNIFFVRQLKKNGFDDIGDFDEGEDHFGGGDHYQNGIDHNNYHPPQQRPNRPGVIFWGGGFAGYGDATHFHASKEEWDYWHPEQAYHLHNPGEIDSTTSLDDFELDFYQADQWIDLASIV